MEDGVSNEKTTLPADESPGWLTADVERRLGDWFGSTEVADDRVRYETEQGIDAVRQRLQWDREAAEFRAYAETLPRQPWADDRREQAAVRYWLQRFADEEQRTPMRRVRVHGRRGRFTDPFEAFAQLFERVHPSRGGFTAQCPAHQDRSPSLSVSRGNDNRLLVHCHAGCHVEDVLSAVGWRLADLFPVS